MEKLRLNTEKTESRGRYKMNIGNVIYKLRNCRGMTEENLAEALNVTKETVTRWENDVETPDIVKTTEIAKLFDISLDVLLLNKNGYEAEDYSYRKTMVPHYENVYEWELYNCDILTEYQQCIDEGLEVEQYKGLFEEVAKLPKGEIAMDLGDTLFKIVSSAKQRADYKYIEPSSLRDIKALRKLRPFNGKVDKANLREKVEGAWRGRMCGCMLGKPTEGIRTYELIPFLKETNNYPLHRYTYRSELTEEILSKYKHQFAPRQYVDDDCIGMPADDDMNYVIIVQEVIKKVGRDFAPIDVLNMWMEAQVKRTYCTAERVAYVNFSKGYAPPQTAIYKNPYREWIGAQIRADYYGYINPGNPEKAAEMAWRDASVSHTKNGIYGAMFVAAMLAIAATTTNFEEIILGGLAQIPATSRLYEDVMTVVEYWRKGKTKEEVFALIHEKYDEDIPHRWCGACSNSMIVAASLLYCENDYSKVICTACETGFDTDCNGATAGSVFGMAYGAKSIPKYWTEPLKDTLHTSNWHAVTVKVTDRINMTMDHIEDTAIAEGFEKENHRPEAQ